MTINDIVFHDRFEVIFKVIAIGDPAVDKTSLLTNFCSDKFEYEYIPTVGVNITKEPVTIKDDMGKDITVNLFVWDIAAQPQFYMLHRSYFNGADGLILVFDCMKTSTFSHINNWWQKCIKYGLRSIPRVLVGIKKNIIDKSIIPLSMARHLSEKLDAPYFEASILTGDNIKIVFHKIAELIYKQKIVF